MGKPLWAIIILCAAGCAETPAPPDATPYPFLTDSQGRALILHGLNVMSNAKSDPLRMPAIDETDVRRMVDDWGFNHVRFLIFWDAIEPTKGQYDRAYLDRVEERLDWFAAAGIHVILDMHQDVYAARFCCDGAPEWAIRDDGQAFERQDQWFLNYFQPAVQAAFDNFWDAEGSHGDLQVHYREAWAVVVKHFKDHPAVIGYDLMNEPHPGSLIDEAELLGLPSATSPSPIFDQEYLTPFYQRLIDRIRQEDSDNWILLEPRYGAPGNGSPSWHGPLDDPREGAPRLAYYPHLYSIALEANEHFDPETDLTVAKWEHERRKEADRQEMPLLIGEWGLARSTGNFDVFMHQVLDMADRQLAGWAYWSYDPGSWSLIEGPDRQETEAADILTRTYAQRVAGRPTAMHYAPETGAFSLAFETRPGVTGPTEIFVPKRRHYPDGFRVFLNGESIPLAGIWDEARERLSLGQDLAEGAHRIEIERRSSPP